ncbi:hypothetical protein LINPERHAP1_LOCUS9983, partial [Linum perenne]
RLYWLSFPSSLSLSLHIELCIIQRRHVAGRPPEQIVRAVTAAAGQSATRKAKTPVSKNGNSDMALLYKQ